LKTLQESKHTSTNNNFNKSAILRLTNSAFCRHHSRATVRNQLRTKRNRIKIITLTAKKADLTAKNNAVSTAYANVSNSRIARDTKLYSTDTRLFDIASEIKKYVKSVFGASSPQFAQVKEIQFKKVKK
jgi:hypothetical protein